MFQESDEGIADIARCREGVQLDVVGTAGLAQGVFVGSESVEISLAGHRGFAKLRLFAFHSAEANPAVEGETQFVVMQHAEDNHFVSGMAQPR